MKANGKIPQTIHTLADLTKRLVSLYVENVKFTAAEKLTVVMSAGVLLVVAVVLGIFCACIPFGSMYRAVGLGFAGMGKLCDSRRGLSFACDCGVCVEKASDCESHCAFREQTGV